MMDPRAREPEAVGARVGLLWPLLLAGMLLPPSSGAAQSATGTESGEWRYVGGNVFHQRYSPLDQIAADNFEDLEVAWIWRGNNFDPAPPRGKPLMVDGIVYSVVGNRRTVVAIDAGTGETLWTYREPHTTRWERSTRIGHGKGVSYGEVDGRGVIFVSSPAFFLHALDA
jgi:glucose dehydrogenase